MRHLLAKQEGAKAAVRTIASGASGNERQRELQRDRTRVQTNQVWTGKESTKRNTSIQIQIIKQFHARDHIHATVRLIS